MKLLLISIMMSVLLLLSVSIGNAHLSTETLKCSIFQSLKPDGEPRIIATLIAPNGLFAELYDVNHDYIPDLAIYSPIYGFTNRKDDGKIEYPHSAGLLYEIDFPPQDKKPDIIYIDIKGLQKCSDLLLYYNLFENKAIHFSEYPQSTIINWKGVKLSDLR